MKKQNFGKKFKNSKAKKAFGVAICLGLMCGGNSISLAATEGVVAKDSAEKIVGEITEYNTAITKPYFYIQGVIERADDPNAPEYKVYKDAGVSGRSGYTFKTNTLVKVDGASAIKATRDVTVDAGDNDLSLESNQFVINSDKANTTINAKNINIKVDNKDIRTEGIHLAKEKDITINGDLNIQSYGGGDQNRAIGAYITEKGKLTVNGNVTMKGDPNASDENHKWGVSANGYGDAWHTQGLYAGYTPVATGSKMSGSTIVVNGDVDLEINGTALLANSGGSSISVDGGKIKVNDQGKTPYFAMYASDADISMNYKDGVAGNHKVQIDGNAKISDDGATHELGSSINIGLTTADSYWHGVVDNRWGAGKSDKALNLTVSNGASWINDSHGALPKGGFFGGAYEGSMVGNFVGGDSVANSGHIHQKDAKNLTIDNYSGNAVVVYEHTGDASTAESFAAGNTIIKHAAENSMVTMSTNNAGIDTTNDEITAKALNNLAGKLTYSNYVKGERNLAGKVQIAEGLTNSSASKVVKDIAFDETTGQGGYIAPVIPSDQTITEFTTAITGGTDQAYVDAGVKKSDGTYKFTKDTTITGAGITGSVIVDATNHKLTINNNGGTLIKANGEVIINGDVSGKAGNAKYGLTASRSSKITINGDLAIKGDSAENPWGVSGDGYWGPYSTAGIFLNGGGEVNVNGNIDLAVEGTGIMTNGNNGLVNVDGAIIKTKNSDKKAYYAVCASGGIININNKAGIVGDNLVQVSGNVALSKTASPKDSKINLGLNTQDSFLKGTVDNEVKDKFVMNMTLANGATWTNESYGTGSKSSWDPAFTGSAVTNFVGGSSANNTGYIHQKDAKDLTVDNYSGNTVVVYEHTGDGSTAESFAAGNTIIKHAAENSMVTMSTNNAGIDTTNDEVTAKALNNLAGKLTYSNYVKGERNLAGKVQIAEGLTNSSASKVVKDIAFDETTGQGGYVAPEKPIKPVIPEDQTTTEFSSAITGGNDQAYVEGGVRKADGTYKFTKETKLPSIQVNGEIVKIENEQGLSLGAKNSDAIKVRQSGRVNLGVKEVDGKLVYGAGRITVLGNIVMEKEATRVRRSAVSMTRAKALTPVVNIGLSEGSTWTGIANNDAGLGEINLYMENGSNWINENNGTASINGSNLNKLVSNGGLITQKDDKAINIGTLEGTATTFFEHEANDPTKIIGGNVIIGQKANAESKMSLSLSQEGIDTSDTTKLAEIGQALAEKLAYNGTGIVDGDVSLSEGLLSSSINNIGTYKADTTGSTYTAKDSGIEHGDYETAIMRGAKSAMMTSAIAWNKESADLGDRIVELSNSTKEDGIWTRVYGGKTSYDAGKTNFETSFSGVQVGIEKEVGNAWKLGTAFSYLDGDSNYEFAGKGENKSYSGAVYGTWKGTNGEYAGLVAKAGRMSNEYTVNSASETLEGEYKNNGVSLSAEYGKKIDLNNGSYLSPEVELTYGRLGAKSYNAHSEFNGGTDLTINHDAVDSLIGRIGLGFSKETQTSSYYGKLSYAYEFGSDLNTTFSAPGQATKSVSQDMSNGWFALRLGTSQKLAKNTTFYADVERTFGGDYNTKWQANAGLNFEF